jgi:hypothetical protein
LVPVERGRWWEKWVGEWTSCRKYVHKYVNAKMIPVEVIAEIRVRRDKGVKCVGGESKYDIYCTLSEPL